MVCDRCGQTASLRISEGGVERWVCGVCADYAMGSNGLLKLAEAMTRPRRLDGVCPYCRANEAEAKDTGVVGCPLCYVAFGAELWQSLGLQKTRWTRSDAW